MQVIENDSGYMSQPLYFNKNGERAPFQATRLSDFKAKVGDKTTPGSELSVNANLNAVLVIQVPLKHTPQARHGLDYMMKDMDFEVPSISKSAGTSDVENAVISHGPVEGPFKELNGLSIKRDDRFPVRVTVQFYKATSNGLVSDRDVQEIREQIDRIYQQGDYVGSLVSDGKTLRPTEMKESSKSIWARPIWTWHKNF